MTKFARIEDISIKVEGDFDQLHISSTLVISTLGWLTRPLTPLFPIDKTQGHNHTCSLYAYYPGGDDDDDGGGSEPDFLVGDSEGHPCTYALCDYGAQKSEKGVSET